MQEGRAKRGSESGILKTVYFDINFCLKSKSDREGVRLCHLKFMVTLRTMVVKGAVPVCCCIFVENFQSC